MNQVEKVKECDLVDGKCVSAGDPVYIRQGLGVKTAILQTVPIVQVAHNSHGDWYFLTKNGDLLDPRECWSSRASAGKDLAYNLDQKQGKLERELTQVKQALRNLSGNKESVIHSGLEDELANILMRYLKEICLPTDYPIVGEGAEIIEKEAHALLKKHGYEG